MKVCIANANPKKVNIIFTLTYPYYSLANYLGKIIVPSILDRFTLHGPNNNYTSYIIAPASASLSDVKDGL